MLAPGRFCAIVMLLLLTACAADRPVASTSDTSATNPTRTVFVGTTRAINTASGEFGSGRSATVAFAHLDVEIARRPTAEPGDSPGRTVGHGPARQPKPGLVAIYPDAGAFRADLAHALASNRGADQDAVIFVHGFNTDFASGVSRFATVASELNMKGVLVHYSWPSAGKLSGYAYDRDSARFARDGLELLINQVEAAGARRILLVAHSMGADLVMEALRQAAIRGDTRLRRHLAGVILISPDIDVDVFHAQALAIGQLPQPFVIMGSALDPLLSISAALGGQPRRLGNLRGIVSLADLQVTYLDISAYVVGSAHSAISDSPDLITLLATISDLDATFMVGPRYKVNSLPAKTIVRRFRHATKIVLQR